MNYEYNRTYSDKQSYVQLQFITRIIYEKDNTEVKLTGYLYQDVLFEKGPDCLEYTEHFNPEHPITNKHVLHTVSFTFPRYTGKRVSC